MMMKTLLLAAIAAIVVAKGNDEDLQKNHLETVREESKSKIQDCLKRGGTITGCTKELAKDLKESEKNKGISVKGGDANKKFRLAAAGFIYGKFAACMSNNTKDTCFKKIVDENGISESDVKKALIKGGDIETSVEFSRCKKNNGTECKKDAMNAIKEAFPKSMTDDQAERALKSNLAKEVAEVYKSCKEAATNDTMKKVCKEARKASRSDDVKEKEAKFYNRRAVWAIAVDTFIACTDDETTTSTETECFTAAKTDFLAAGGRTDKIDLEKIQKGYANKDKAWVLKKLNNIAVTLEIENATKAEIIAKLGELKDALNAAGGAGAVFKDSSDVVPIDGVFEVDFISNCTDTTCTTILDAVSLQGDGEVGKVLAVRRLRRLLEASATTSVEQGMEATGTDIESAVDGEATKVANDIESSGVTPLVSVASFAVAASAFALTYML